MKKGYFFTMDAVIGVIVLIIGLLIVAGFYFYSPEKTRTESIADDISGLLGQIKVGDLCSTIAPPNCECSYTSLEDVEVCNLMTNQEMTLLELIGLLYSKDKRVEIEAIINQTIIETKVLPLTHGMQVILEEPGDPDKVEQLYPLVT